MRQFHTIAAMALGLGLCSLAPSALANGKFPSTDQLVVDPADPLHIVTRSTFGMLTTRDGGGAWGLICEAAVGYADYEPPLAVLPTGNIIVGLRDGLNVSSAEGCNWDAAADIGSANVVDVSVSRSEPRVSVAIEWDVLDRQSRYHESRDDGRSFQPVGQPLPGDFEALTVDVAPSDPSRIYVSGLLRDDGAARGVLARSDDRGASWVVIDVPSSDEIYAPYIAAVHPTDPNTIYVRLSGGPGRLYVSRGGGLRLHKIWESDIGNLLGFALSPDGSEIAVGTEFDGLWRANADERVFRKKSSLPIRCLAWAEAGIYACVNSLLYGDGFIVGLSEDDGATFEPLLTLPCVRPVECADDSRAAFYCPNAFDELAQQLETHLCDGAGGAGGSGGAAPVVTPPTATGGCSSCAMASPRDAAGAWGLLGVLVVAVGRRFRVG